MKYYNFLSKETSHHKGNSRWHNKLAAGIEERNKKVKVVAAKGI